ncbi:hypothetical protein K432DRAFT_213900 [Lepidopterella palustris CBS 459.81]|uniref:Uncharacterized protein n=1 Tax=Lepidopterella palustris CBS 459.81 TaxID=1314670 RepID=A0A8E2EES4_9PEZI|nr:hypothetical protein K432DRAFT_213900 [Lepidopterella palustris CBS 459.81]
MMDTSPHLPSLKRIIGLAPHKHERVVTAPALVRVHGDAGTVGVCCVGVGAHMRESGRVDGMGVGRGMEQVCLRMVFAMGGVFIVGVSFSRLFGGRGGSCSGQGWRKGGCGDNVVPKRQSCRFLDWSSSDRCRNKERTRLDEGWVDDKFRLDASDANVNEGKTR